MQMLITGANGFIGSHLVRRILERTDWQIVAVDREVDRLRSWRDAHRLEIHQADVAEIRDWTEAAIARADVVLPLAAVANPKRYVTHPLETFQLNVEKNLWLIAACARAQTRLIFPSSSEVYGTTDAVCDEEKTPLTLGPVQAQRWIYACGKQMLDRVIWAHGSHDPAFRFTIFRPFNWVGPYLDRASQADRGEARVVTQFLGDLTAGRPLRLVDGGTQKRCLTSIEDGVEALMAILGSDACDGKILNIGHPENEISMRDLAFRLRALFWQHPLRPKDHPWVDIEDVPGNVFYGPGYEDIPRRRPSINAIRETCSWRPQVPLDSLLQHTLDAWMRDAFAMP